MTHDTVTPRGGSYRGPAVQLDILHAARGEMLRVEAPPADEAAAVLIDGDVSWLGQRASRRSVFEDRAAAVYIPPAATIEIEVNESTAIALVATTVGALVAEGEPVAVTADMVSVAERGEASWRRDVHDVVTDRVPAQRLLVGETFNAAGGWSSFPPHKHDGRDGEPALDEVYYYRFDQPDGFGLQGLYDRDGNERAEFVRDGSVVGFASGYHPVCAAPGYRLYYLWALAGAERRLSMYEDPAHRWLHAR